ncbi:MAG: hypothetical protein R3E89_18525 [Thiolinea sp.]
MKLKSMLISAAVATVASGVVLAKMSDEMTVVSWGGAYSNSQLKAYHEPYMADHEGFKIINDESSNEAVAKLHGRSQQHHLGFGRCGRPGLTASV